MAQVAAPIREFGWTNPALVDDGSGMIVGHGRVLSELDVLWSGGAPLGCEAIERNSTGLNGYLHYPASSKIGNRRNEAKATV